MKIKRARFTSANVAVPGEMDAVGSIAADVESKPKWLLELGERGLYISRHPDAPAASRGATAEDTTLVVWAGIVSIEGEDLIDDEAPKGVAPIRKAAPKAETPKDAS